MSRRWKLLGFVILIVNVVMTLLQVCVGNYVTAACELVVTAWFAADLRKNIRIAARRASQEAQP